MSSNIILGDGVFAFGSTAAGLTRGGGTFTVEREYREIEADGDFGPVKGRVRKIRSVAKLTLNALELLPANLVKMYPSLDLDNTGNTDTITATSDIVDGDYNDTVTWTGFTKGGREVVITLENAINMENIEWNLVDKEEIVPVITFTATYDPTDRTTEPWKIEYVTDEE